MNQKKIVVRIQSDPRTNHRACEGIRIALGLAASDHQVSVLLTKQAVHILQDDKTDWVDEERLEHFLSAFEAFPNRIFVDTDSAATREILVEEEIAVPLSPEACAKKIAQADCFFNF